MANEFFLLTWYEKQQMVLVERFLGIGALSDSTFEESRLGRKESMWCCILRNNMNTRTVNNWENTTSWTE